MKAFVLALSLAVVALVNSTAQAKNLTFKLKCKWDVSAAQPVGDANYEVVKTAFIGSSGKWVAKYTVVATPLNPMAQPVVYELENTGGGDEDYFEYDVVGRTDASPIQGAVIQNQFKWVHLQDQEGFSSYVCR